MLVTDELGSFLCCGASLDETFQAACDKAEKEAMMLMEDLMTSRSGYCQSGEHIRNKIMLSRTSLYANYFLEKSISLTKAEVNFKDLRSHHFPLPFIAEVVFNPFQCPCNISYAVITEEESFVVVRAFSQAALQLREERRKWGDVDPIC